MYPRNAASPERIAIGAVVQISDGAVQTSGVAVKVIPFGQSESSGAGTVAYTADGVVLYTPTQAETNYTSFVLVASKSGCIPATVTVVTSAAGIASIADAVWDEQYNQHTTAGTFGKLQDTLRKANNVIEGTILSSPTPTTTVFKISGADYPTGALEHSVLWMASGAASEQNSPILTTVNNGDGTLTITLEEALTVAPTAGDTVLIDPSSHVHAIADIQAGLALATELAKVPKSGETRRYTQIANNTGNKTADVSIGVPL